MADISELRSKSPDELKDMAVSLKKELFNLRFLAASGESPNTARFRQVRRDVARVKTLLNEPAHVKASVSAAPKKEKKVAAPKAEKAEKPARETKAKKTTSKKKAGE